MRVTKRLICTQFLFVLIFFLSALQLHAEHLKGGWIKYVFVERSGGYVTYTVSFYQYSDCSQPEKVDRAIYMAIYNASTFAPIQNPEIINLTKLDTESRDDFG